MREDRAREYVFDFCANIQAGQVGTLSVRAVHDAFPKHLRRYAYDAPMLSSHFESADTVRVRTVTREMTTVEQLREALGPDFNVEFDEMRQLFMFLRVGQIKNFFVDEDAMNTGLTSIVKPARRATKPRPKRVKPAPAMRETPLAQRFSGLDFD